MSYAEQIFNVKQNQVLQYAENLAFFGEDSYVYKNENLMKEVIANEVALLNPTTAYYCYLWARENGYAAIDYFNVGLVIALYHSELNTTYHFVLVDFNEDGSGLFINQEPCVFLNHSQASNGSEVLNYEHYESVQYLNGENNWYNKWEDKPASNSEFINVNVGYPFATLRNKKGFLSGFDYRLKKLLKTFKEGYKFPILPITYDDFNKYAKTKHILSENKLVRLNKNCVDMYEIYANTNGNSTIFVGRIYYGCLIEEVTTDQIINQPKFRAGWDAGGGLLSLETVQNGASGSCPSITGNTAINLKIQF